MSATTIRRRERRFLEVWAYLAALARVDEAGGASYRRCLDLFRCHGRPAGVAVFIVSHADLAPVAAVARRGPDGKPA